MKKWIMRIIFLVLLGVFLFSAVSIGTVMYQYHQTDQTYDDAVKQFVRPQEEQDGTVTSSGTTESSAQPNQATQGEVAVETQRELELAPFVVDFDALKAVNSDVAGWIYCPDTVINYPVMHGSDNDLYLHHLYDKTYSFSGSIFVEKDNRKQFQDANTIIYGHNMKNNAMFGTLDSWSNQAYYEAHPTFWLLTPEQDYRIEIMAGYTVSAYADTYTIFSESDEEFVKYLEDAVSKSDIQTDVEIEQGERYVLLSTCAYVFNNARFVLHGKLVPVDSAGGIPKVD